MCVFWGDRRACFTDIFMAYFSLYYQYQKPRYTMVLHSPRRDVLAFFVSTFPLISKP